MVATKLAFDFTVDHGIAFATQLVAYRYGKYTPAPIDRLAYHTVLHTERVSHDAGLLAKRMGCSPREIGVAKLGGAFHDTCRKWTKGSDNGVSVRVSNSPIDEAASAAEFVEFHTRVITVPHAQLSSDEIALVVAAIMATVPKFGAQCEVWQPLLTANAHSVVRAVALADLNAAALADTPQKVDAAAREADLLFREREIEIDNFFSMGKADLIFGERAIDIANFVTMSSDKTVPGFRSELPDIYRKRMLRALSRQDRFLSHRTSRLRDELGPYIDDSRLKSIINVENINLVRDQLAHIRARRTTMDFWELATDMGYMVPAA